MLLSLTLMVVTQMTFSNYWSLCGIAMHTTYVVKRFMRTATTLSYRNLQFLKTVTLVNKT